MDSGEDEVFSLLWFRCNFEGVKKCKEISENTEIDQLPMQKTKKWGVISVNNIEKELNKRSKYEEIAHFCSLTYVGRICCPEVLLNCL